MADQFVHSKVQNGVLVLTLDDPKTRNSLGPEMNKEMTEQLNRFESDQDLRVLVITGADPAFCSGANVRGFDQGIRDREAAGAPPPPNPWERFDPTYMPSSNSGKAKT